jgi:hypothetical protein
VDVAHHCAGHKRPSSLAAHRMPHRESTQRRARSQAFDETLAASSYSTDSGPIPLKICVPPSNSSPSSSPPPLPPDFPVGAPGHCPPVELCVLHRFEEVDHEERDLKYFLVTIVGGTCPAISVADVRSWLLDQFQIPGADVHIHRYCLEDFLITFSFYDDMLRVLHDQPPLLAPFSLMFKRWRRQALASAESLLF